jgi:hypothetical protein
MVGMVEVPKSEWNKLPIFMLYNPFFLTNGITPKENPSLLMLKTSKLSGKFFYYYDILYCIVFTFNCHWLKALS